MSRLFAIVCTTLLVLSATQAPSAEAGRGSMIRVLTTGIRALAGGARAAGESSDKAVMTKWELARCLNAEGQRNSAKRDLSSKQGQYQALNNQWARLDSALNLRKPYVNRTSQPEIDRFNADIRRANQLAQRVKNQRAVYDQSRLRYNRLVRDWELSCSNRAYNERDLPEARRLANSL